MSGLSVKISIIGGGLSALYSFFGAVDAGYEPSEIEVIVTELVSLTGTILMYDPVIPFPPSKVTSILYGTCRGYAMKQHRDPMIITSAHKRFMGGLTPVITEDLWLPQDILPILWSLIPIIRRSSLLEEDSIHELAKNRKAVICTFPSPDIRKIAITAGLFYKIPVYVVPNKNPDPIVIYNGSDDIPWVRMSTIRDNCYIEYPRDMDEETILTYEQRRRSTEFGQLMWIPEISPHAVRLPEDNIRKDNILRVGRFSTLSPSYLSHHAREEVKDFLGTIHATKNSQANLGSAGEV